MITINGCTITGHIKMNDTIYRQCASCRCVKEEMMFGKFKSCLSCREYQRDYHQRKKSIVAPSR